MKQESIIPLSVYEKLREKINPRISIINPPIEIKPNKEFYKLLKKNLRKR